MECKKCRAISSEIDGRCQNCNIIIDNTPPPDSSWDEKDEFLGKEGGWWTWLKSFFSSTRKQTNDNENENQNYGN